MKNLCVREFCDGRGNWQGGLGCPALMFGKPGELGCPHRRSEPLSVEVVKGGQS